MITQDNTHPSLNPLEHRQEQQDKETFSRLPRHTDLDLWIGSPFL